MLVLLCCVLTFQEIKIRSAKDMQIKLVKWVSCFNKWFQQRLCTLLISCLPLYIAAFCTKEGGEMVEFRKNHFSYFPVSFVTFGSSPSSSTIAQCHHCFIQQPLGVLLGSPGSSWNIMKPNWVTAGNTGSNPISSTHWLFQSFEGMLLLLWGWSSLPFPRLRYVKEHWKWKRMYRGNGEKFITVTAVRKRWNSSGPSLPSTFFTSVVTHLPLPHPWPPAIEMKHNDKWHGRPAVIIKLVRPVTKNSTLHLFISFINLTFIFWRAEANDSIWELLY